MNRHTLTAQWKSLPEKTVRQLQAEKLKHYLREVVLPGSAHYRECFRRQGFKVEAMRTLEDFSEIPFTTKQDLLAAAAATDPARRLEYLVVPDQNRLARQPGTILRALLHGTEAVKRELAGEYRPIFMTSTTGRAGIPVPFLFTQYDLANLAVTGERLFEVCGARPEHRHLNMFPFAPHLAFWQTHYGGTAYGVFTASTGGGKVMGTEGQLRFIRQLKPDVLIGMPTFAYHVLHQAAEQGIRCDNLKRLVLGGEKVPEGMREKLRHLAAELGATVDVVATYGFTECKMAFAECPFPHHEASGGYHIYPDLALIEVIDPATGKLVPSGHPGEIVFTPLDARGTVVLRYRTGDLIDGGLVYGPCPHCGRQLPRLLGNISRTTEVKSMHLDKLKGTLVDFNQLEHVLDDAPHLGAWQLELRKVHDDPLELDELVLHVEKFNGVAEAQLKAELNDRFAAETEVHLNRIQFHDGNEMRQLQGVGSQLKEMKVVDHRPASNGVGKAETHEVKS
jgi:phenylacetate-CoA ligase